MVCAIRLFETIRNTHVAIFQFAQKCFFSRRTKLSFLLFMCFELTVEFEDQTKKEKNFPPIGGVSLFANK